MEHGILLSGADNIDFMIHGVFKYSFFGHEVWITTTHVCLLIIMLLIIGFAIAANRCMAKAREVPEGFQNVVELIVEKLDGMVDMPMGKAAPKFYNYIGTIFIFILVSNISGLLGLRPPTADYGVTLPLGVLFGGKRELVAPLCQQAMDLGFDGLIVESHCNPDAAWSDASQQVTPDVLDFILDKLVIRKITESTESLTALRRQIDEIDNSLIELMAKRMRISREIGEYKRKHDMTVVQTSRYTEILDKRGAQGVLCGMSSDFIKDVFESIHEESVRQQIEVMNQ